MKDVVILVALVISTNVIGDNFCSDKYDYQHRRLFEPPAVVLAQEKERETVFIYEGFTDQEIQCALDNYPDRIERSMFIGTIITDTNGKPLTGEDGEFVVEDDGCN